LTKFVYGCKLYIEVDYKCKRRRGVPQLIGQHTKITDSEWEVMRVVWTNNKVTSKEIIQVLERKKGWKPPTTKTFIGRLVKKGMLNTEKDGNRYLYTASVNEDESIKGATSELFELICNKEVGKTIAELISEATLSYEDIALLEEALKVKKKDAVDEVECNCTPGQCHCQSHH